MIRNSALAVVVSLLAYPLAFAERPGPGNGYAVDANLVFHDSKEGLVRVFYVTESSHSVPLADEAPSNGVPDYVELVAEVADTSLLTFAEMGYRLPLKDTQFAAPKEVGGDDRLDIYLSDFANADGSFPVDDCNSKPDVCAGYAIVENDFAGSNYPSTELGIKTVVSHELFHGVQNAYDAGQDSRWSEGSAVWAEEMVFPEQDDFDRYVGRFLEKPARPFDRDTGSAFGDPYPYGSALWPAFIAERFAVSAVREIWEECEDHNGDNIDFLSATDLVLATKYNSSLSDAWTEFTHWNLFTGTRADSSRAYKNGHSWSSVAFEETQSGSNWSLKTSTEGLSARYIPIEFSDASSATVLSVDTESLPTVASTFFPVSDGIVGDPIPFNQNLPLADHPGLKGGVLILTSAAPGASLRRSIVSVGTQNGGCSAGKSTHGLTTCFLLLFSLLCSSKPRSRLGCTFSEPRA